MSYRELKRWRRRVFCRLFGHPWRRYPVSSLASGVFICDRCNIVRKPLSE